MTAEWEIIFQRSDGVKKPPLVQLSYDHDQDIHPFPAVGGRDPYADEEVAGGCRRKKLAMIILNLRY